MSNRFKILLILIFIFGTLIRFWNLSNDPSIFLDSGQVGDEGYWTYNARNLSLFGNVASDGFYHDFAAAPLFSFVSYFFFKVFGVGFWQARLVSSISGVITLIFTYLIAKQINQKVAVMATFFVSINTMLIMHSRLAVAESLSIMFATIGFYFLLMTSLGIRSTLPFVLSLLAKTTSVLYFPSALLIIISNLKKKTITVALFNKFFMLFSLIFMFVLAVLYINFGKQILIIYTTFGKWYVPKNFSELWQNIYNFFLHPFWGSPFLFTLLILAIINALNYMLEKRTRTTERKFFIFWLIGITIFGPLISILSNARLLGLIIPIAILGTQTITDDSIRRVKFQKIASFLTKFHKLYFLVTVLACIPISVISSKVILAVIKRINGNDFIVNKLPYVSAIFLMTFVVILLKRKRLLEVILKFDVICLLFLPIASFVPLFWSYLNFFNVVKPLNTTISSVIILMLFILFYFIYKSGYFSKKLITVFTFLYLFFNFIGISSIFYKHTNNIINASYQLGRIVENKSVIGFYGQELSFENKSKPIYWAPNLNFAENFNFDWEKYQPRYLLVSQIFDSKKGGPEAWPKREDITKNTQKITTLDLTRNFLNAKREFKIDVYSILD